MGIIEIKDLSFSYPGLKKMALDHINLSIEEGEFFVLCGKSGCGKSTLFRHLRSSLMPHGTRSGFIFYKKESLFEMELEQQCAKIGYVMQNPDNQIVTDKVWHELAFGLENLGFEQETIRLRVAEMASYFGIQDWFYKEVADLSGGQKQLLNLAAVMALHPSVLILDEPTSQLDPITAGDFLDTIHKINQELGTTIIMTEHRLEEVLPMSDRVSVMEELKVLHVDTPSAMGTYLKENGNDMFLAMPAPMQIYAGVENNLHCPVTVRQGRNWLKKLLEDKKVPDFVEKSSNQIEKKEVAICCKEVWYRYEKDRKDVVKGLDLTIYKGEFYCLLGGNGTGKSTMLSLLSRVRKPYRGKILLEGKNINQYSNQELYHNFLGVLPQNQQSLFVKKTVEEELYEMVDGKREKKDPYFTSMGKKEAVEGIAVLTQLDQKMNQHPYDLSGGEQQRLALAKIMLLRPKYLLLDEPTKGMDAYYKEILANILRKLKEHGVTIIMVSHDVEFCAKYGDRCGLFFDGSVVVSQTPVEFFSGNNFYTTASNRMVRNLFPKAVTVKDVIACCKNSLSMTS